MWSHSTKSPSLSRVPSLAEVEISPSDLVICELLGSGSFGSVYRGRWKQHNVAVKVFRNNPSQASIEARTLLPLRHENVVRLFGVCYAPPLPNNNSNSTHDPDILPNTEGTTDSLFPSLLMELALGGPLHRWIEDINCMIIKPPITYMHILHIAVQIARGMQYLHEEASLCHCDLKTANVLMHESGHQLIQDMYNDTTIQAPSNSNSSLANSPFSEPPLPRGCPSIMISDFGLSRSLLNTSCQEDQPLKFGTVAYASPEVCRREAGFHPASDVWSFGVVLWELLTFQPPYKDKEHLHVLFTIASDGCSLLVPFECPQELVEILNACWKVEYSERPSFRLLVEQLEALIQQYQSYPPSLDFMNLQQVWNEMMIRTDNTYDSESPLQMYTETLNDTAENLDVEKDEMASLNDRERRIQEKENELLAEKNRLESMHRQLLLQTAQLEHDRREFEDQQMMLNAVELAHAHSRLKQPPNSGQNVCHHHSLHPNRHNHHHAFLTQSLSGDHHRGGALPTTCAAVTGSGLILHHTNSNRRSKVRELTITSRSQDALNDMRCHRRPSVTSAHAAATVARLDWRGWSAWALSHLPSYVGGLPPNSSTGTNAGGSTCATMPARCPLCSLCPYCEQLPSDNTQANSSSQHNKQSSASRSQSNSQPHQKHFLSLSRLSRRQRHSSGTTVVAEEIGVPTNVCHVVHVGVGDMRMMTLPSTGTRMDDMDNDASLGRMAASGGMHYHTRCSSYGSGEDAATAGSAGIGGGIRFPLPSMLPSVSPLDSNMGLEQNTGTLTSLGRHLNHHLPPTSCYMANNIKDHSLSQQQAPPTSNSTMVAQETDGHSQRGSPSALSMTGATVASLCDVSTCLTSFPGHPPVIPDSPALPDHACSGRRRTHLELCPTCQTFHHPHFCPTMTPYSADCGNISKPHPEDLWQRATSLPTSGPPSLIPMNSMTLDSPFCLHHDQVTISTTTTPGSTMKQSANVGQRSTPSSPSLCGLFRCLSLRKRRHSSSSFLASVKADKGHTDECINSSNVRGQIPPHQGEATTLMNGSPSKSAPHPNHKLASAINSRNSREMLSNLSQQPNENSSCLYSLPPVGSVTTTHSTHRNSRDKDFIQKQIIASTLPR